MRNHHAADRLTRQVARAVEAAYRRGVGHGYVAGTERRVLEVDLARWRAIPLARSAPLFGGRAMDAIDRVRLEAPELWALLEAATARSGS